MTILLPILLLLSFSAKADIVIENFVEVSPSKYTAEVKITDDIKKVDLDTLDIALKKFTSNQLTLIALPNSHGGNLTTAIGIGRILRKYNTSVLMLENDICYSACVFIIAGAPKRDIYGKVGIHRPYLQQDNQTTVAGQRKQKSNIDNLAIKYLREMNISEALYSDMVRISPQDIKILSKDDLLKYGLGSNDPYFEDAENAKKAKSLGIPTAELISRKSVAKRNCNDGENIEIKERINCFDEIIEKGNINYQVKKSSINKAQPSNKDLINTMDKLRPDWREITNSTGFKEWKMNLSESDKEILDKSWNPYLLNDKIQQFLDTKNPNQSASKSMRLACLVNKVDMLLNVNFEKSTVNGTDAQISDNHIRYTPDRLDITINRATGSIMVEFVPPYSKRGIPLLPEHGQCKVAKENSF